MLKLKHETGMCEVCNINETEHVIINCHKYKEERMRLKSWFRKEKKIDLK